MCLEKQMSKKELKELMESLPDRIIGFQAVDYVEDGWKTIWKIGASGIMMDRRAKAGTMNAAQVLLDTRECPYMGFNDGKFKHFRYLSGYHILLEKPSCPMCSSVIEVAFNKTDITFVGYTDKEGRDKDICLVIKRATFPVYPKETIE